MSEGRTEDAFPTGLVLVWRVGTADARQPPAESGSRVSSASHEADPATRTEKEKSIRLLGCSPPAWITLHSLPTDWEASDCKITHIQILIEAAVFFSISQDSWLPPLQRAANSIRKKIKKNRDPGETRAVFVSSENKYIFKWRQFISSTRMSKKNLFIRRNQWGYLLLDLNKHMGRFQWRAVTFQPGDAVQKIDRHFFKFYFILFEKFIVKRIIEFFVIFFFKFNMRFFINWYLNRADTL